MLDQSKLFLLVATILFQLSSSLSSKGEDDLRLLRAQAIRSAVSRISNSIVRVEKFGIVDSASEVADDAPTVAIAIDDSNHFIASSMVTRQSVASIVLVAEDGTRSTAKVIATDHHRQLVLLESSDDLGVSPVVFADPHLEIGQTVVAVGRIAGDGSVAVSSGVLSARDRLWGIALQTDARVSSVFYGGALIDLKGQLVGVLVPAVPDEMGEDATAWYDAGVAFAIPSQAIAERLPKLLKGEDIHSGLLGIVAQSNDPYIESTKIAAVRPRSPAARAEIQSGDIVLSINGEKVTSHRAIKQVLGSLDAGQELTLELERNNQSLSKQIVLAQTIPPLVPQWLGITVTTNDSSEDDDTPELIINGVFEDTPASKELKIGDILKAIDGSDIDSEATLRRVVFAADPTSPLSIKIERTQNDGAQTIEVSVSAAKLSQSVPSELPDSLSYDAENKAKWTVETIAFPDIANKGFIAAPQGVDEEAAARDDLGFLLLLADPGDTEIEKHATAWLSSAKSSGVIVCVMSPSNEDRWQPDEIDAVGRVLASVSKRYGINSLMTAISGVSSGSGSSMAMAVAISKPGNFAGLAVPLDATPPAIRLRENDVSAPLQLLLRGEMTTDSPSWSAAITKSGFAVLRGDEDDATLLRWVRSIPRI